MGSRHRHPACGLNKVVSTRDTCPCLHGGVQRSSQHYLRFLSSYRIWQNYGLNSEKLHCGGQRLWIQFIDVVTDGKSCFLLLFDGKSSACWERSYQGARLCSCTAAYAHLCADIFQAQYVLQCHTKSCSLEVISSVSGTHSFLLELGIAIQRRVLSQFNLHLARMHLKVWERGSNCYANKSFVKATAAVC